MAKNEIAEIFILGQKNPPLCLCAQHNFGVADRRRNLRHIHNVMSGSAQVRHQSGVETLIDKPAHG
jgi:hypothetical protein